MQCPNTSSALFVLVCVILQMYMDAHHSHTHLYSIVKACVRPPSYSDILAHGRGAALHRSFKAP